MMNESEGQAVEDWNIATGLPQAVVNWQRARRECQCKRTDETLRRYLGAEDELARALLGDFITEPMSNAVFERFKAWLIETQGR